MATATSIPQQAMTPTSIHYVQAAHVGPAVSTAAAMGPLLSGSGGRIAGAPSPVKIYLLFQSRGATLETNVT